MLWCIFAKYYCYLVYSCLSIYLYDAFWFIWTNSFCLIFICWEHTQLNRGIPSLSHLSISCRNWLHCVYLINVLVYLRKMLLLFGLFLWLIYWLVWCVLIYLVWFTYFDIITFISFIGNPVWMKTYTLLCIIVLTCHLSINKYSIIWNFAFLWIFAIGDIIFHA